MISWIVASHDRRILNDNLLATLDVLPDDELILIEDAPSITVAYTEGQSRATKQILCFIHHDVRIIDQELLRRHLISATEVHHLVGVVGSRTLAMPWWNGRPVGSVGDTRLGVLVFGGWGPARLLDGLLLASRAQLPWDTDWPGWHGYDYDICMAVQHELNGAVWCMDDGAKMLVHNSDSPQALHLIDGWPEAEARFYAKWGSLL